MLSGQGGILTALWVERAARWHRTHGSCANSGGLGVSHRADAVCAGRGLGVPETTLEIQLKLGNLGKLNCSACFSNPNSTSWGSPEGGLHPRVSVLFTP